MEWQGVENMQIKNLSFGKPKEYQWGNIVESSGIGKETSKQLQVKKQGIEGDDVANHDFHGGIDRAVCLYPFEHYAKWESDFNTKLKKPAFGENITAIGMLEKDVCIGDIYKIGGTVLQVTQGRVPCSTISKYNDVNLLLKQIVTTGLTGYFFRVLEEGVITEDSKIQRMEKHPEQVSVYHANHILFHHKENVEEIERILTIDELSKEWQQRFNQLLTNIR